VGIIAADLKNAGDFRRGDEVLRTDPSKQIAACLGFNEAVDEPRSGIW
jgi:hypothetical protein